MIRCPSGAPRSFYLALLGEDPGASRFKRQAVKLHELRYPRARVEPCSTTPRIERLSYGAYLRGANQRRPIS